MKKIHLLLAFAATATSSNLFAATLLKEDFSGSTVNSQWTSVGGACLTAGSATSIIPRCSDLPYYNGQTQVGLVNNADPDGAGALRLTNGGNNGGQAGAIVINNAIKSSEGLQVTFSTVTYGGNNLRGTGADGLAFYMIDGKYANPQFGPNGGSLGYGCSAVKNPTGGLLGGYLGLGVDEYGNYLNRNDNTATGLVDANTLGDGRNPGTIGLRGRGEVNWVNLNASYGINPNNANQPYYPSTMTAAQQITAVQDTCRDGVLRNYRNPAAGTATPLAAANYNIIAGGNTRLQAGEAIANEAVTQRAGATPITYKLQLTPDGLLNFSYSYNNSASFRPVLTNTNLAAVNGAIPATFKFGFGSSSGGGTNVHEISCFSVDPLTTTSSAAVNTVQSGEFRTGIQTYLAGYRSENWTGQLVAKNIVANADNSLSFAANANWDASCVLTGGNCSAMGVDAAGNSPNIAVQTPANRNILSWNGTAGIPFQWASLSAAQQVLLTTAATTPVSTASTPAFTPTTNGQDIVAFLRGDRSKEQTVGVLRKRLSVLGDIIDASPVAVGAPTDNFPTNWIDRLYATTNAEGSSYAKYKTDNATRLNVVYSGANDGLLHAFRSGSYATDGSYNNTTTPNDGLELLAYMPNNVLVKAAKLANPYYSHDYYQGATPSTGDLYYGGAWHTWLVSGLGAGGTGVYALDITDPTNFKEANAASLTKGEWDSTNIVCTPVCNTNMGNTFGTPIIRRLHNGQWAIIFGNGFSSTSGLAGVYIGLVDKASGAVSYRFLSTGLGSSTTPNGIGYVSSADLDSDRVTDYLYAGDLLGNVWRFDLTSSDVTQWGVSKFGNTSATPLYKTANPITTKINVVVSSLFSKRRLMIMFATGQKTLFTTSTADTYAAGTQSVYGVWDWDMDKWNTGTTTTPVILASKFKYYSLTGAQTIAKTNLLNQPITVSADGNFRYLPNNNTVNWSTGAAGGQYGWVVDLPASKEQSISNGIIIGSILQLNTVIPPATTATINCNPPVPTAFQMAFNILTGGGNSESFFQDSSGSYIATGSTSVQGIKNSAVGSSSVIQYKGESYLITNSTNGLGDIKKPNPPNAYKSGRVGGWRQIK